MADIESSFLIKTVLRNVPHGQPIDLTELAAQGVSAPLAAHYAHSGWLERLSSGVYRLPGAQLDRDRCLLFLQSRIRGLHVGGKTALAWQGIRHNLLPIEILTLWGSDRKPLPQWFMHEFPSTYRTSAIFDERTLDKGLITPPGITAGVLVSARERAVLELIRDVRSQSELEEAHHLFSGTQGMRITMLGELLEGCISVKTVRIFLLWAKQSQNVDVTQLCTRFELPTGGKSRWIGRLADGTKLVLPA